VVNQFRIDKNQSTKATKEKILKYLGILLCQKKRNQSQTTQVLSLSFLKKVREKSSNI